MQGKTRCLESFLRSFYQYQIDAPLFEPLLIVDVIESETEIVFSGLGWKVERWSSKNRLALNLAKRDVL